MNNNMRTPYSNYDRRAYSTSAQLEYVVIDKL